MRAVVVIAALWLLAGCAEAPLPEPQATVGAVQALRMADGGKLNVGAFTPGPGAPRAMDQTITVRAATQSAPEKSFARYLADTIRAQLTAAGRFDPAAALTISGVVTDAHVDSSLPKGHGRLAARFTLTREGAVVFDKTLEVESTWDSNFVGAVAIPEAINNYIGLYPQLATKLFADPDFVAAARRR